MYKRKKKLNSKLLIILTSITIILLLSISVVLKRTYTPVESFFKDIAMEFNKVIMYPFTAINKTKEVNQNESYIIQKNVNSSLEKEIAELKETLELNRTLTEYDIENATVLSRNKSYWFNTITLDKGKKDGIKENMAVITKNGLIGKISKVSNNSSELKLLTSDDINFKVSVSVKVNDVDNYAILNGYDKEKHLLKVTGIDKMTTVKKDDIVLTSGLGELFPAGIFIGTVESQENDKYNLSKTLYIKTRQDFNNIHYVTILKEKK